MVSVMPNSLTDFVVSFILRFLTIISLIVVMVVVANSFIHFVKRFLIVFIIIISELFYTKLFFDNFRQVKDSLLEGQNVFNFYLRVVSADVKFFQLIKFQFFHLFNKSKPNDNNNYLPTVLDLSSF